MLAKPRKCNLVFPSPEDQSRPSVICSRGCYRTPRLIPPLASLARFKYIIRNLLVCRPGFLGTDDMVFPPMVTVDNNIIVPGNSKDGPRTIEGPGPAPMTIMIGQT